MGCHHLPVQLEPNESLDFMLLFHYDLSATESEAFLFFKTSPVDLRETSHGTSSEKKSSEKIPRTVPRTVSNQKSHSHSIVTTTPDPIRIHFSVDDNIFESISAFKPWPSRDDNVLLKTLIERTLFSFTFGAIMFVFWYTLNVALDIAAVDRWCRWSWKYLVFFVGLMWSKMSVLSVCIEIAYYAVLWLWKKTICISAEISSFVPKRARSKLKWMTRWRRRIMNGMYFIKRKGGDFWQSVVDEIRLRANRNNRDIRGHQIGDNANGHGHGHRGGVDNVYNEIRENVSNGGRNGSESGKSRYVYCVNDLKPFVLCSRNVLEINFENELKLNFLKFGSKLRSVSIRSRTIPETCFESATNEKLESVENDR